MFIRSPYNYDADEASNESALSVFPETKTQQHFKDECDINRIVAQFAKGLPILGNASQSLPEGFYELTDYQTAMNTVRRGTEAFNGLNSQLRAEFNNDAQLFVDFVTNPANIEAVRELGLAPGKPLAEAIPSPSPSPAA